MTESGIHKPLMTINGKMYFLSTLIISIGMEIAATNNLGTLGGIGLGTMLFGFFMLPYAIRLRTIPIV